jgi:medium-chain acyl-CoA synthetase
MQIFFTSGTTSEPKMAEHTHASYGLGHLITGRFALDLTENDVMYCVADTGWAKSAYSNVFAPWIRGACVFIQQQRVFEPINILKVCIQTFNAYTYIYILL